MIKNANVQFCFQAVHTQSDPIFISNNINVYIKTQFLNLCCCLFAMKLQNGFTVGESLNTNRPK